MPSWNFCVQQQLLLLLSSGLLFSESLLLIPKRRRQCIALLATVKASAGGGLDSTTPMGQPQPPDPNKTTISASSRDDSNLLYRSGIPTLRSSAHRVKTAQSNRKSPKQTTKLPMQSLPDELLQTRVIPNDSPMDLLGPLKKLLDRCDDDMVGSFVTTDDDETNEETACSLERFQIPIASTWRKVNGGQCEAAQVYLSEQVAVDDVFLEAFHVFVTSFILPNLKRQLLESNGFQNHEESTTEPEVTFYFQSPPTLRLQPGPAWSRVKPHRDAEYGHQNGELNFWMPFTDRTLTKVDLWCEEKETESNKTDPSFAPVPCEPGDIVQFHGSTRRHTVNCNATPYTRVSMDFRVGIQGFFDPFWQMKGTTNDHGRTEFTL